MNTCIEINHFKYSYLVRFDSTIISDLGRILAGATLRATLQATLRNTYREYELQCGKDDEEDSSNYETCFDCLEDYPPERRRTFLLFSSQQLSVPEYLQAA